MEGPLLWYANRGTGAVLLVLFTLTTVLGVLSTRGDAGRGLPRFVTQSFHRNLSLLSLVMLVGHVATAVVDEYVDIRWWQAVVPFGATYKPLWLSLGTLALDLFALIVLTSLLRHKMAHRPWRLLHLSAYAAWALSLAHGLGIGTDAPTAAGRWLALGSAGLVALAVLFRLGVLAARSWQRRRTALTPSTVLPTGVRS